ncbi:acetyl-CoA carboxylase biotin carboxylase subunit [Acuticoccus kandeliae]|uniref:acetyl-CoA carboxylase biotin carboxylase subunit n=1 Tax=Acuticoccus kandeliae TaxID=2073160 RepID=UPI000D3E1AEE|nr:acetyl-CoA carboxylase biotin carboxylase subunit [Acuticoccus kandeliae]
MFDAVLVANRGEIALRIIRAARTLGLRTIAVHSTEDAKAGWLAEADTAIAIGPARASASYLNGAAILMAAQATGAGAIHPGYGFLSENAAFAQAVTDAGLVFVGPPADCIRRMGDKMAAKRAMRAAGVPCVPGPDTPLPQDPAAVRALAEDLGYPVMIKAAGGGGGRGMRLVRTPAELAPALEQTREEAARFFGDPTLYIEKFLTAPRHVEIQVLCDTHGTALWLGDRDCSLQRRHQKLMEEAPAPGIDRAAVAALGARCAEACRAIDYVGAGTFEFLYQDGAFHFIEMNTRIQVEHPVTEMVTGLDIVALQLRVARGERLDLDQTQIAARGHAIECRINAEHPSTFVPSAGTIAALRLPQGQGVRVDTHIGVNEKIPACYDSLLAKLIVHGTDRADALRRMREALDDLHVEGIETTAPLHRRLLRDPAIEAGAVGIDHLERWLWSEAAA